MNSVESMIKSNEATIIDVRTPAEFMEGHVAGSINIPLNEIPNRIEEFRSMKKPVVLCCASGNRSGQAAYLLQQNGVEECYNGGSWLDVNYIKNY